jgi:glutathione peroxidase
MRILFLLFAVADGLKSSRYSTVSTVRRCGLNNGMQIKFSPKDIENEVISTKQTSRIGGNFVFGVLAAAAVCAGLTFPIAKVNALEEIAAPVAPIVSKAAVPAVEDVIAQKRAVEERYNEKGEVIVDEKYVFADFKIPYNHENLRFKDFLGKKATIVFNMKIDDPQTVTQFPNLLEIYQKYAKEGLNVHAFPSEQGWFEPDDDETVRAKAKEYFFFGNYPSSVVFDKVDYLGPSAHPLYAALTKTLNTPNGYGRITLNYEKFLLDAEGNPVRRYPRKYTAYDMEADIVAVMKGIELI